MQIATVQMLLPDNKAIVETNDLQTYVVSNPIFLPLQLGQMVNIHERKREIAVKITFKQDLWSRCTPEEAAIVEQSILDCGCDRKRLMFRDCLFIDHFSEDYWEISERIEQALMDYERVAELLKPSFDNTTD